MASELFNKKTIERLCSSVVVSVKQKKAAKEWLELLKSDLLRDEKKNYPKFMEIILKDLLGYNLKKNLFHEEGNIEFPFKYPPRGFVVGFEAKGTFTKDLFALQPGRKKEHETPTKQVWDYMGGKLNLQYGVVTNYKDFVLLDRTKGYSKYHKFDFTSIEKNESKLKEFIAIFSQESIVEKGFLEELYKKSVVEEREFTKEFYKLFHETRLMLIKEFQDNGATKEDSIHFAQLFLNRLMFVFFAEDTGRLERRLFEREIIKMLETDSILSDGSTFICATVTNLFAKLNSGSDSPIKIFGFNGGLFKEEVPRGVFFKDLQKKNYFKAQMQYSQLKKHPKLNEVEQKLVKTYKDKLNPIISNMLIMASYDFKTEVNVNILGHIFEQSLSDLEEIKEGGVSRRKKEGVYYTPEYITDYICRNTIIPYLSKKGVIAVEDLLNEYSDNISELEKKFREIKILDPACGSGAFLIKAVEVLLEIQKGIQEIKQQKGAYTRTVGKGKKKVEGIISLVKWKEEEEAVEIIENNIFGVDINEESTEITKLSLFLKIARKNKKLIDLSKNIKCGNSLIDDPKVDEKAFDWKTEFKEIFDKGRFGVVIGNPPYVRIQNLSKNQVNYLTNNYNSAKGNFDLYLVFVEKGYGLLNENGFFSFINPNKFFQAKNGRGLREYLSSMQAVYEILNFKSEQVFEDVTTYTCILTLNKKTNSFLRYKEVQNLKEERERLSELKTIKINSNQLNEKEWYLLTKEESDLLTKITLDQPTLKDISSNISQGFKTGNDNVFINSGFVDKLESDCLIKVLKGVEIRRNYIQESSRRAIFPYKKEGNKMRTLSEGELKSYKRIYSYLLSFKKELLKRDRGRIKPNQWYLYSRNQFLDLTKQRKIITRDISQRPAFALDQKGEYGLMGGYGITLKEGSLTYEYVLAILNSNLSYWFISKISTLFRGNFYSYESRFIEKIPITDATSKQDILVGKAKELIKLNFDFFNNKKRFLNRLKDNLIIKKISEKLDSFYNLDFKDFCEELKKQNVVLAVKQQDEWEDYFKEYKEKLLALKAKINKIDNEIDEMVYELYGISEKEKKIIEESLN